MVVKLVSTVGVVIDCLHRTSYTVRILQYAQCGFKSPLSYYTDVVVY